MYKLIEALTDKLTELSNRLSTAETTLKQDVELSLEKSVSTFLENVTDVLARQVQDEVAKIPPPENGKDADEEAIQQRLEQNLISKIPDLIDYESIHLSLKEYVDSLPKPKDAPQIEDIEPILKKMVDGVQIPQPDYQTIYRVISTKVETAEVNLRQAIRDGKDGKDGKQGKKGKDGKDGIGIKDIRLEDNVLIVVMSNNKKYKFPFPIINVMGGTSVNLSPVYERLDALENDTDSTSFLALTDTPDSYNGNAQKNVAVNSAGTGLEFTDKYISDVALSTTAEYMPQYSLKRGGISRGHLGTFYDGGDYNPAIVCEGGNAGGTPFLIKNENGAVRILPYFDDTTYIQHQTHNVRYSGYYGARGWFGVFDYDNFSFLGVNACFGDIVAILSGIKGGVHIKGDVLRIEQQRTPSSSGAAGNAGEICWDSSYLYMCVATNNWKRIPLQNF